jgi:hypothetical protein
VLEKGVLRELYRGACIYMVCRLYKDGFLYCKIKKREPTKGVIMKQKEAPRNFLSEKNGFLPYLVIMNK